MDVEFIGRHRSRKYAVDSLLDFLRNDAQSACIQVYGCKGIGKNRVIQETIKEAQEIYSAAISVRSVHVDDAYEPLSLATWDRFVAQSLRKRVPNPCGILKPVQRYKEFGKLLGKISADCRNTKTLVILYSISSIQDSFNEFAFILAPRAPKGLKLRLIIETHREITIPDQIFSAQKCYPAIPILPFEPQEAEDYVKKALRVDKWSLFPPRRLDDLAKTLCSELCGCHPGLLGLTCQKIKPLLPIKAKNRSDIAAHIEEALNIAQHKAVMRDYIESIQRSLSENGDEPDTNSLKHSGLLIENRDSPVILFCTFGEERSAVMASLSEIVKSYFTSAGDPREPAKLLLKEGWRQLFPDKDVLDVFTEALAEAFRTEPKVSSWGLTASDAQNILKYEISARSLTLEQLTEPQFRDILINALCKNLPFPGTCSPDDQRQIATRIVERTLSRFTAMICSEEKSPIWKTLMVQSAQAQGKQLSEIHAEIARVLPEIRAYHKIQEDQVFWIGELRQIVDTLGETSTDLKSATAEILRITGSLSPDSKGSKPLSQKHLKYKLPSRVLDDALHNLEGCLSLCYTKYIQTGSERYFDRTIIAAERLNALLEGDYTAINLEYHDIDCR